MGQNGGAWQFLPQTAAVLPIPPPLRYRQYRIGVDLGTSIAATGDDAKTPVCEAAPVAPTLARVRAWQRNFPVALTSACRRALGEAPRSVRNNGRNFGSARPPAPPAPVSVPEPTIGAGQAGLGPAAAGPQAVASPEKVLLAARLHRAARATPLPANVCPTPRGNRQDHDTPQQVNNSISEQHD